MTEKSMLWLYDNVMHIAFGIWLISLIVIFYVARAQEIEQEEITREEDVLSSGCIQPIAFAVVGVLGFGIFLIAKLLLDWTWIVIERN